MVTRDEQHSTRGRARLLYEMLRGEQITDGWASEAVHDALDLCLSCKGCKGECPVQVDMASYKAEFLSHYYEHHRRPRSAYAFGLIHRWAELASYAPRLVNAVTQTPVLRDIAKLVAGMARERRIPAFAPMTFREWFSQRPHPPRGARERVILWPDTFNNHFHPQTAAAAVDVLEDAGFAVDIPPTHLCCGRPLYDYGMLDAAKVRLQEIVRTLYREIDEGVPIVGLEPSCIAVFRDELRKMLPDDARARRLSTLVSSLAEFLDARRYDVKPVPQQAKAIVQGHCHQRALYGMDADQRLLDRLGLDYEVLDAGCCGMAGSFGFEADHYEVSQAVGERRLLPRVRSEASALVVADGFSCREQIAQATGRRAQHLAEVLAMGLARRSTAQLPLESPPAAVPLRKIAAALLIAGGAIALARFYNSRRD
jgi:Fe-S oxidoreductase